MCDILLTWCLDSKGNLLFCLLKCKLYTVTLISKPPECPFLFLDDNDISNKLSIRIAGNSMYGLVLISTPI